MASGTTTLTLLHIWGCKKTLLDIQLITVLFQPQEELIRMISKHMDMLLKLKFYINVVRMVKAKDQRLDLNMEEVKLALIWNHLVNQVAVSIRKVF